MEIIIAACIIAYAIHFAFVRVPAAKARDALARRHDELVDLIADEEECDYGCEPTLTPSLIANRAELAKIRRELGI